MFSTIQTREAFRIIGIAASPAAPLAILSIASILGIGPRQAADHLASLPTVLADNVAAPDAHRLSALLTALGLKVRLDPTFQPTASAGPTAALCDLALQPTASITPALIARLSAHLALAPERVRAGLNGPEGLVLPALPDHEIARLRACLRREKGIRLAVSDPETATFDLFARQDVARVLQETLRLGLARCTFSGAIAAGLNKPTARYLARRLAGRTAILNRDFQRYDLYLPVSKVPVSKEISDFIMTRRARFTQSEVAVQDQDMRVVESDLRRPAAMDFAADYALIGLTVKARVRGAGA